MLKIISIVVSLADPNSFLVAVSGGEFKPVECEAVKPQFEEVLRSIYSDRTPGGISIKSECKSQEDINAFLEKLQAEHPDAKPGQGS